MSYRKSTTITSLTCDCLPTCIIVMYTYLHASLTFVGAHLRTFFKSNNVHFGSVLRVMSCRNCHMTHPCVRVVHLV